MARRVAHAIGVPVDQVTGVISSAHIYISDLAAIEDVLAEAERAPCRAPCAHGRGRLATYAGSVK
jgi:thymidylate synthase